MKPVLAHLRKYSGQPIANDPRLAAIERETGFHYSDAGAFVSLNTHNAATIKQLLRSDFVRLDELELYLPDECVVGLSCSFPIGALSIHTPRQDNHSSRVVSRAAQSLIWHPDCVAATQIGSLK